MYKNFQAMLCERISNGEESVMDRGSRPEENIKRTPWGQYVDQTNYYFDRFPKDSSGRRYF